MAWLDYWPLPWRLYGALPLRYLIALCLVILVAVLWGAWSTTTPRRSARFDPGQVSRPRLR